MLTCHALILPYLIFAAILSLFFFRNKETTEKDLVTQSFIHEYSSDSGIQSQAA